MGRTLHAIRIPVFAAILLLAMLATLELGATAAFHWFEDWPSRESIQRSLDEVNAAEASTEKPDDRRWSNVLHPYLGYVRNPLRTPRRVNRRLVDASINEFGFFGASPLSAKGDDVARVVITGGSVAEELFLYAGETLARELEAAGAFDGRKVEVLSLSMAGFKQPQQLIAVSYLLLLGAEFDAVVNIDGFNEVVLPFTDNAPLNVAPSYPFRWNALAADSNDAGISLLVARITESSTELEAWRGFFSRFPLRHSAFALASWSLLRTGLEGEANRLEAELRDQLGGSLKNRPSMRGPPLRFESNEALFDDSVEVWKRASIQLWHLCRSHDIAYLQLLQPNQYVRGSKPFTPSERKVAILPIRNPTRIAAEAGYARLIAAGGGLTEMGLPFFDITDIFERVVEPIYRDSCCHYRDLGYQMIVRRIARELGPAPP